MSRESRTANLGTAEWFIGAAKNNPEGLLLVAAGCALLMRRGGSSAISSFGHAEESRGNNGHRKAQSRSSSTRPDGPEAETREGGPAAVEAAREYVSEIGEKVAATASSYASSASTYADEARRNVSQTSEQFARRAQSTLQDTMNRVTQEQPLTLALLGFAAGAAVAAAFRTTEIENRTLGPAAEQLTDTAERAGERLKESTEEAGKRLRRAAEERGLNADGLKEVASDVAGAFGSALSGEQPTESAQAPSASSGGSRAQSAQRGMPQSGGMGRSQDKSAKSDQSPQSDASRPSKSGRSSGKRGS
ncbi:MAG: hypothetical protein E5Y10_33680 [Mesorhizobium sp.]|uniref:hypothetical protein n=2 Tax=Mesorhizobium sp. TaxID=1871066 RepID=UPI000FE7E72D|nr:hypothetical protein [Mesorhizobium sp.]RWO48663.1 MAG: hypothetical protein EOS13_25260 [Mesorhizobium sp.]TIN40114.1 MAG: hypothetical protein E5Y13_09725 [Mesorhizobium sp.]TJU83777.1 MAG: hypothetical protein E5Y10_33680 [Mesorhizobium sp.]